ncbi:RAS p21 protein activator 3 [Turdus rufiventris]|nr:RAS p21 protein activator 3 [Turdus rufiventris]
MQVSQWKSSDCVDQDRNNHAQHLHCVLCGSGEEEEEECELDEPMDMVGAGKVAIQKEDLQKYHNRDTWFQLQHVDADSEVQVNVRAQYSGLTSQRDKTANQVLVYYASITSLTYVVKAPTAERILKDNILAQVIINDVMGKVHLELRLSEVITDTGVVCHKLATRSEAKKTKVKKKTNNPHFDEVFYFEVTRPSSYNKKSHFDIEDVDEVDKMEIRVDLWNASNLKFGDEFLGELRLPLKFLRQSSSYEAWYFLQPRDNGNKSLKPDDLGSLRLNVVYTEDHVFSSDYYSPLRDILLKSADVEICQVHKPCEIDPVKLKDGENLENNRENLRQYVDRIFTVITKSGVSCPTVMCDIFFSLRESAAKRFQGDLDVRYTAVSSFIFLRFFAPAILSPNLFQLTPHHPDPQTSRTLTLISKTIQTLGSLSKSKSANFKESYMASFYDYFNEQKYADAVKNFLDLISSSGRRDHKSIEQPILLKEGFMIKRAQGRKRFGMKNFKKRWFRLTNHEFTYQKSKGDHPLCSIPIENILAVERLEEESFKMKNMFQVIQPERRVLYIQANNCVEAKDWIDILTKVSQCNKKRLTVYHPSAYLNGHWLCCKATADNTPGCTPCTGGLPANIQLDIDGDRETERIYSLFNLYMPKLEKMQEACGSKSVYDGPEEEEYSTFIIDDPKETYKTLKLIIEGVGTLEQEHAQYKRDKFKKTKYGSQEHPIGDKSFQTYIRQQSEISAHSI